jgi:hypothetical protein
MRRKRYDHDANGSAKLKISCGQRLWRSAMALDRSMLFLQTAGGVAGMLPVVGEQMKAAVELASTICELVKVLWDPHVFLV